MSDILDKQTIKALSTDTRQEIMKMLARRPYTASEISKITHKHVTTVAEHLDVLEKSGLVRKKDSTNKWVYYTLTDKGEHLFKPQFYSWVIVLSLSIVLMFVGVLRVFRTESAFSAVSVQRADLVATASTVVLPPPIDYLSFALIGIGVFGLGYLLYEKYVMKV